MFSPSSPARPWCRWAVWLWSPATWAVGDRPLLAHRLEAGTGESGQSFDEIAGPLDT